MYLKPVTLEQHIIESERRFSPHATGDFSGLLSDLCLAFKIITREVRRAGLVDVLGFTGVTNVQGEAVRKLDELADELIRRAMDHGGHLCAMASEEVEGVIRMPKNYPKGKYVLLYDPLDGSSNIDANVSIGSIFSIFQRVSSEGDGTLEDCLQPGWKQKAAGYALYSSSTLLVYTTGHGVHGFTLDPTVGEFLLSHQDITTPARGKIYSCNESNYRYWQPEVCRYIDYLKGETNANKAPYTSRYIGSLVADFHRNLLYGGVFLYPADAKGGKQSRGKLRLLYEAFPLAFIAKQAGGFATDGKQGILDIAPEELHQRTPLFIGSHDDMVELMQFMRGEV
ncbi:MAG: class 1 fructose-bisphosphatase [Planctomycetota bacterium]